ncbi:Neurochondrin-domain-containing protein [Diaporthe sp. PMI_573]|nr:Neurochondrin-domain-containing protein [Diaporthaceae sp. PMI_573]
MAAEASSQAGQVHDADISDNIGDNTSNNPEAAVTIQRIQELLKTKNDTSRFVGLALLKSVLDNSPQLREDEEAVTTLWHSVSPKFLDRLLRSGAKQGSSPKDARDMIDIAVGVVHIFSVLLPDDSKKDPNLVGRIPALVSVILHSSNETTQLVLQTLLTLVSRVEGAKEFVAVDDVSALIEIAPSQPLALDIFLYAYSQSAVFTEDTASMESKIDNIIRSLVASFKGTDAVTLLAFLAELLRRLSPECLPQNPVWLKTITGFIRNLVTSKPTAAGRAAYTNLAATLLQIYPAAASRLLFTDEGKSEKPFPYLLVNLILVDLRSSFPNLLARLNDPDYESISKRIASAFDVVSGFIGFLVRFLEDESLENSISLLMMSPDFLFKLRQSIAETLSLAIEYLRDRWDGAEAGAMGLHPDARPGVANTSRGSHFTLSWDSKIDRANQDPLILAAVRTLALWLREDENDMLRKEATGLTDMFMDLYKSSAEEGARLDFRRPVLVALEGTTVLEDGTASLLDHNGWEVLTQDLLAILRSTSSGSNEDEAARGIEIVRVLIPTVERESPGSREAWMAVVTAVAGWDVPDAEQSPVLYEFQVAVLQLVAALMGNTHPGMQRRYVHSISAVLGIVEQLMGKIVKIHDEALEDNLRDVETTLSAMR